MYSAALGALTEVNRMCYGSRGKERTAPITPKHVKIGELGNSTQG